MGVGGCFEGKVTDLEMSKFFAYIIKTLIDFTGIICYVGSYTSKVLFSTIPAPVPYFQVKIIGFT